MFAIHILSGEAMLIAAIFLFYRTMLNHDKCVGCAACELACPTGTLTSDDRGKYRYFSYSHYQCICCGSCVATCPEDAAEVRHQLSFTRFFQILFRRKIQTIELKACKKCGGYFAPEPQLSKITEEYSYEYLDFCSRCRRSNAGKSFFNIIPNTAGMTRTKCSSVQTENAMNP